MLQRKTSIIKLSIIDMKTRSNTNKEKKESNQKLQDIENDILII